MNLFVTGGNRFTGANVVFLKAMQDEAFSAV